LNGFIAVLLLMFLLAAQSCEQVDNVEEQKVWQGTEESFETEFSYQADLIDDSVFLTRNGSTESYSGFVEINQSGTITEQIYADGRLNGKSIKKSTDGSWVEANYVDGKLDGPMKLYDRFGELRSTLNYSEGKLLPGRTQ
jgi:antitoxin component YwqK of YwqJK toxin-antitoxin module